MTITIRNFTVINALKSSSQFNSRLDDKMTESQCNLSKKFLQACQKGDVKILKNIRELHKIENWTLFRHDVSGDTGLHVAAREGHLDVVKYLCEEWHEPSYRADVTNKDMKRPLHEAAQFARSDVLQYIIEQEKEFISLASDFLAFTYNLVLRSDVLQYIIEQDVQIDSLKRADWTPLMLACTKSGNDARKCVQSLLNSGANACLKNSDGWNSLLVACRTGDADVVELLLHHAPKSIHNKSNNGRTGLHIAAFHGSAECVEKLVSANPDILYARDSSGSTALHESAKSGILRITKRLIEMGANPQTLDDVGQTVLHVAAACGNIDIINYLLENSLVNLFCEDKFGVTAMMAARRHNRTAVIDVLTKFEANKC